MPVADVTPARSRRTGSVTRPVHDTENGALVGETPKHADSILRKFLVAAFRGVALYLAWLTFSRLFLSNSELLNAHDAIHCAWMNGQTADLYVYISEEPIQTRFDESQLALFHPNVVFGLPKGNEPFDKTININIPPSHKYDAPIFGHVYLMKQGVHPDPVKSRFHQLNSSYRRIQMTGLKKELKDSNTSKNIDLETNDDSSSALRIKDHRMFWYTELHIGLVNNSEPILSPASVPIHQRRLISTTLDGKQYLPTLYLYEAWRLADKQIDFTSDLISTGTIPLRITFSSMGKTKFSVLANLAESFQVNQSLFGIAADETEKLKEMFFETNSYLLGITLAVSLLHTVFDFLAFKNGTNANRLCVHQDAHEYLSLR